jgi:MatE
MHINMSTTRSNKSTQAAVLLMCLSGTQAFSTGRPLSLVSTYANQRNSIPGRAPVDVFYVDDESSKEQSKCVTKPEPESLVEPFTLSKELIVDHNDDETLSLDCYANDLQELEEEHNDEVGRHLAEPTLCERDIPPLPTLKDLRKFALPCFGLLLSGPLLSLVDTAFVGLASTNAMELAALGPATTLFDCLTWFLSFLNVATTSLYSSALAKGDQNEAEGVVRTGSRIALSVGLVVMATLMVFCKPILSGYMGKYAYMHATTVCQFR